MRLKASIYAAALVGGLCTASFGQIAGKVTLQGDPPEPLQIKQMAQTPQCAELHKDPVYEDTLVVSDKNEIANVIVFIDPGEGKTLTGPKLTKAAVLDQKGCMYTPHVVAVEVGQPMVVKNSDPFLHNVHALSIDNAALAVCYGFAAKGSAYAYLSGFDPSQSQLSPGTLIISHAVEQSSAEGAARFDFLRGHEEYKYGWGAVDRSKTSRNLSRRCMG